MNKSSNIELFRVGPYLFSISFPISDWRPTERIPSLAPFLLSEEEAAENYEKSIFSIGLLLPENEENTKSESANRKNTPYYHQLVEFE